MEFRLFDALDLAIVKQEKNTSRASATPAVWPSEASALRIDQSDGLKIVGKCMRASYYRMTGQPITNSVDAVGAWRWVTGRLLEEVLVDLAKQSQPSVFVASGVRTYVKDLYMPLEIDVVTVDPHTKRAWLGECKTYYGYYAKKEIETQGRPKLENLMQCCLYLLEVKDGARLKTLVAQGLKERAEADSRGEPHRNRIEANLEALEKVSDGPVGAKILYLSRDEVARKEFDIEIKQDFDGSHYPSVDGQIWKIFTIESIYERYRELQNYWFVARREAVSRLAARNINPPAFLNLLLNRGDSNSTYTPEQKAEAAAYLSQLEIVVQTLPDAYLPPAEYEYAYSPSKIETLFPKGLITKKAYEGWKKKKPGMSLVGDWNCRYCSYKNVCVPKQRPDLAYIFRDLDKLKQAEGETEV